VANLSADEQRFMAFEGLVQWTTAVVRQAERVREAKNCLSSSATLDPVTRRQAVHDSHCQDHYFIVAAKKTLEYRNWAAELGLFSAINFAELDGFSIADIKELRDMREPIVAYFQGHGHAPDRWVTSTPEYIADASSVVGTIMGGRLDWVAFSAAANRLLPALLAEPIPFPASLEPAGLERASLETAGRG
jgi:hypothetical protein